MQAEFYDNLMRGNPLTQRMTNSNRLTGDKIVIKLRATDTHAGRALMARMPGEGSRSRDTAESSAT